jgi:hypothetical protein
MDKCYQVFVSSTYADLKEERQRVIQALMEMDCIPSGMEVFPAADEEQWEFIKHIIDDCDYYLLIIGGRYGSTAAEGVSYTEKEYDYAIQRGIKVIAFLHENPDSIPLSKSEQTPELRARLKAFREKVASGRLVKFWKSADQLPGLVALSLSKTIKMFPAVGWIRADKVSSEVILAEINEVRKENERLRSEIQMYKGIAVAEVPNLAPLDDSFEVSGTYFDAEVEEHFTWSTTAPWKWIFGCIAPYLLVNRSEDAVKSILASSLSGEWQLTAIQHQINEQDFQTIKIQLMALKLISANCVPDIFGGAWSWSLTPQGKRALFELRTVKALEVPDS